MQGDICVGEQAWLPSCRAGVLQAGRKPRPSLPEGGGVSQFQLHIHGMYVLAPSMALTSCGIGVRALLMSMSRM